MSSPFNSLLKLHRIFEQFVLRRKNPGFDQSISAYKMPQNPKIVVLGGQFPLLQNLIEKHFEKFNHFSISHYLKGVSPTEGSSEKQLVNSVGQFLLRGEGKGAFGHILTDFPKNVEQARGLDEILDGVNLAIKFEIVPSLEKDLQGKYLQCRSCGKVFNLGTNFTSPEGPGFSAICSDPSQCNLVKVDKDFPIEDKEYSEKIKALENYYEERGLLMRFRVCEKKAELNFEEVNEKLFRAIETHIKL